MSRCDIVDVVSDYVQLTRRSGSNLFGLCPFHSEKTPSFSVSPERQTFHCFGCGKGGGVIGFVMEIENLPFPDAVSLLARRVGMEVPEDNVPEESRTRRERLLALNKAAAHFFHDNLKNPDCATAVEYIRKRCISRAMVTRFGLGAAPDRWDSLASAMRNQGYSDAELLEAGLVKRGKSGGVYDVFRNRLIFPVIDVRGSVVGFSGRILDDGEPKYLNSPDTPVFQKSRNLFALNLAKRTKRGMLLLVEGSVDVVSLHQAGFDCAVASLGTALTADQARLMKHYTENVVLSYDSDEAGVKASGRAIPLLEAVGLTVRVLSVNGAKDPDEFLKKNGPDAFQLLLDRSANRVDYQLNTLKSRYDLETDEGRLGFLHEATDLLVSLPDAVKRDIYTQRVAMLAGISPEAVRLEVKKGYRRRIAADKKKRDRQVLTVEAAVQPKARSLRYDNAASGAAEEGVIRILMAEPSLISDIEITKEDFTSPFLGKIFEKIRSRYEEGQEITAAVLLAPLPPDEASLLTEVLQRPVTQANVRTALSDYIAKIRTESLKNRTERDLLAVREQYKQKKGFGGYKDVGE